jgi:hypothetical protein
MILTDLPTDIKSIIAGFSDWVDALYRRDADLLDFLQRTFRINVNQPLRDDYRSRFLRYRELSLPRQDTYHYPLEMAVMADNLEMVRTLLDCGANPNRYCEKPLLFHAYFIPFGKNNDTILTALLEGGANVDETLYGKTLLTFAIERADLETVQLCLTHGVTDLSVIHGILYSLETVDILVALLERGLSTTWRHPKHGTLLEEATRLYDAKLLHLDTRFIELLLL